MPAPLLPVDYWALGAVIALSAGAMLLLLLEFLPARENTSRGAIVSLLTLVAGGAAVWVARDARRELFGGMFVHDGFTVFFTLLFCAIGVLSVLLSWDYVRRTHINQAEYYVLLLSSTLGMILMAASNDLITIFLGLELMSLAIYVLVGFRRSRLESNEAALKYFLLGAFASGFLLYGIALLYGATATTSLSGMAAYLMASPVAHNPLLVAGALLLLIGFGYKVSLVPFHMWAPDAYEGAPTSVTAFMSVGAKAAGFAALLRVLVNLLSGLHVDWTPVLSGIAILTMTVGNVAALMQTNVKRMLAYSSIAHAGYVLVAVTAGGPQGTAAALFYLAVYSIMNLGAFGILTLLGRDRDERVLVSDLAGLGFRQPFLGLAMTVFMISLGGIPPTAGFMGKVYVFGAALQAHLVPLVVVGVLNSVVSVFYYLRITVAMYMEEPQGEPTPISWAAPGAIALAAMLALTIWWGVQAYPLLEQARRSVMGLL
ncbi:MAG TPA: NADH-quinone oxidoreductase subunit N [Candidatus Eisenbacteria bacterium]|nr:NADH-quinone oxidoreductase subunit N [Candidatus Eisenbacteria bacterium]